MNEHFEPINLDAKLWPQAERAKWWHAVMHHPSTTPAQKLTAENKRNLALGALSKFLSGPREGLWREVLRPDGSFVEEPVRASSLYHIACATITVNRPYVTKGNNNA